jgi:hypothetical protein
MLLRHQKQAAEGIIMEAQSLHHPLLGLEAGAAQHFGSLDLTPFLVPFRLGVRS